MEAHRFADIFPLIEGEEFEKLKADIKENGLLQPIVLYEGKILDGRNRHKACVELGITPKFEEYKGDKPLDYVISLNLRRRHLNESQRALAGVKYKEYYAELYPQGKHHNEQVRDDKGRPFQASDRAGKVLGISGRMIDMAETVIKEAPKEIKGIEQGEKKVAAIYRELKREAQKQEIKDLIPEKTIKGIYDVIVVDPPWDYGNDDAYDPDNFRGTCPYPVMNLEQIKAIALPCADNCILWMWTTNTFIHDAFHILEHWGFEKKTILTWDKQFLGTGRWLRSQTEHCILAIKGKPYFNNKKWTTLISEKRTTHSTKPEIFYKMIDEICAGRKLDYFARKKRDGWDAYGDEVKP